MIIQLCLGIIFTLYTSQSFGLQQDWTRALGQSFFVGVYGKSLNNESRKKIETIMPGGIILFGSNIKSDSQLKSFISDINSIYDQKNYPRPFIAVDQEGGYVTRIKSSPLLPSPSLMGEIEDQDKLRELSFLNSNYLRSMGINMNLSPVLDIQSREGNDFLGSRSFSSEANIVETHGERIIEGANNAFVVSTAKHFPGHGDVEGDSHKKLPVSNKNLESLFKKELLPYIPLIETKKLPAVMIGHIAFPKIDTNPNLPASFSKEIITGLLRERLKFNGLVITDDIQMEGAALDKHTGKRAQLAIKSGVDMVMIAWNRKEQLSSFNYLKHVIKTDRELQQRVYESYKRIISTKNRFQVTNRKKTVEGSPVVNRHKLENYISFIYKDLGFDKVNKEYLKAKNYKPKQNTPILVFSKYKSFYKNIANFSANKRVLYFHLGRSFSKQKLINLMQKYEKAPIYFQVSNRYHQQIWNQIPKQQKENILLINSSALYETNSPWEVKTKTNLPSVGKIFARRLSYNKKRGLANARASIKKSNVRK
jgi:beta-glucosidase-like glycosyl hydrolase